MLERQFLCSAHSTSLFFICVLVFAFHYIHEFFIYFSVDKVAGRTNVANLQISLLFVVIISNYLYHTPMMGTNKLAWFEAY